MDEICINRLVVLGKKTTVTEFLRSEWDRLLRARFLEPHEMMLTRFSCGFQTCEPPLKKLEKLSTQWRSLIFLLDFEWENKRIKGIAKAVRGELEVHEVSY